MAQTELDPDMHGRFSPANVNRSLGDSLWSTDVEVATASVYNLGVEFDGTNYWVSVGNPTGVSTDRCKFVLMDQAGTFVTRYFQPVGTWGTWGIRDLAFDGTYMYGGNDVWNSSYIAQFDLTGVFTGTLYGPHLDPAMTVTRAVAYDSNNDVFYTANWGSAVYQCDRLNNVVMLAPATGLSCYGAACEDGTANTMLWLWWYDGLADHGSEIDVATGAFTGYMFDGAAGATAGGACAYDAGGGAWELVALHQASPDTIEGYTLSKVLNPLEVDTDSIPTHAGGVANFTLDAGVGNAGDGFVLWASITPGSFPLPGGAMLPFSWDVVTNTVLNYAIAGLPFLPFIGVLDGNGQANVTMTIPPGADLPVDLPMMFAFSTHNPFDFVSNIVNVTLLAWVPPMDYSYDDATSENSLGLTAGGSIGWLHWFDVIPGYNNISMIESTYGSCPPSSNMIACIWNDPNDDGDPSDLGAPDSSIVGITANESTDNFNKYDIIDYNVTSRFFIGVIITDMLPAGNYPAPLDQDTVYGGQAWIVGDTTVPIDPNNLVGAELLNEMNSIGWPYYFLLRGDF